MPGMEGEEQCSQDRMKELPPAAPPREERCFLTPLDLLFESARRQTFARWDESQLPSTQLAQSGFFFTGVKDHVQCIFCLGILGCWSPGEQPDEEHRKQFPECPLVTGAPTGNIPFDGSSREGAEGRLYQLLREYYLFRLNEMQFSEGEFPGAGSARTPTDAYPQFRTPASRLATYVGWPAEVGLCPQDLAAAGFFHSGRADWLQCYSCGGGIFGWQKGEQPLEVHLRYYPLCPFARAAAAPDGSRPAPLLPSGVGGGGGGKGALAIQTEDAELLAQHPLAKRLVEMGLPQTVVKSAFKQRLETYGALCRTILEAVELTVEYKRQGKHSPQLATAFTRTFSSSLQTESLHQQNLNTLSIYNEKAEKLRREVEDLKQQLQAQEDRLVCRVCKQDRVAVVLQPCSHMHLCVPCARSRDTCPSCENVIRGTLRPLIFV